MFTSAKWLFFSQRFDIRVQFLFAMSTKKPVRLMPGRPIRQIKKHQDGRQRDTLYSGQRSSFRTLSFLHAAYGQVLSIT
jgi:hypothetical protein